MANNPISQEEARAALAQIDGIEHETQRKHIPTWVYAILGTSVGIMFAGTIMLQLIVNLLPPYASWFADGAWKMFDLFVGAMQAFIFALLVIVYFGEFAGEEPAERESSGGRPADP